jgi:hypothetical protein
MALKAAHQACFKHEDRPILGMSHGPFSGVNVALGIVVSLETQLQTTIRWLEEQPNDIARAYAAHLREWMEHELNTLNNRIL